MEALEIRTNSIKVNTQNGVTVVSRYDDKNGTYFYNEQLEKQYALISNPIEIKRSKINQSVNNSKEYRFNVQYEHKGIERGWNQKDTKVIAKSYSEAIDKVKRKFKNIYEMSEL
jgi:UDP-3-O-acyl-N-acetylglucosamine deacetylase